MGAWGSGALENDTALDFVDSIKRARKAARAGKLHDALSLYLAFDERRRAGTNITASTPAVIDELRRDLKRTREFYSQPGMKLPLVICPWLASAEAEEAYIAQLTGPRVEDGLDLAAIALAASALLAGTCADSGAAATARCLRSCERDKLLVMVPLARACLSAIRSHQAFIDSWGTEHGAALLAQIAALETALQTARG